MHKLHKYALELEWSGGRWGRRWPGVGREGEGRLYHDRWVKEGRGKEQKKKEMKKERREVIP